MNSPKKHMLSALAIVISLVTSAANATSKMEAKTNQFWWPEQLNLSPLRQHALESNPYGPNYDYVSEFSKLNLQQVKQDIAKTLTDSKE